MAGLFTGFEAYRPLASEDVEKALREGMVSLDTNVLLNLYRYNNATVDDLLRVASSVGSRLFVPHQVVREFWRNRQRVMADRGSARSSGRAALSKNATSSKDAISRWAKQTALNEVRLKEILGKIDAFYAEISECLQVDRFHLDERDNCNSVGEELLGRLETLLEGRVGPALGEELWEAAIVEGTRRVENLIPPGYMDVDKLESDLPEGASGDYIIWRQLLIEGEARRVDLVLITSDTKEDWWERSPSGALLGARYELVDEYYHATDSRLFLIQPGDLMKHSASLGVGTSNESVQDIERVSNEEVETAPWTPESVYAVMKVLDDQAYTQAEVIREAATKGGRISRSRVYELDGREETQSLRAFTRPVRRVTSELQARGLIPYGVEDLLGARYEAGVKTSHFVIPDDAVQILSTQPGLAE